MSKFTGSRRSSKHRRGKFCGSVHCSPCAMAHRIPDEKLKKYQDRESRRKEKARIIRAQEKLDKIIWAKLGCENLQRP